MWFDQETDVIVSTLSTNVEIGLSSEEASRRLSLNGLNKLKDKKKKSLFQLFLSQINDAMIYILLIAAIISIFIGEISDALIILVVIFINAIIGVFQESKAEKALEALKRLSTPKALVRRDNTVLEIPSEELVVGDIVIIDAGRYIPADLRLIESANLKIEESSFTGESLPSEKNANIVITDTNIPIGDRINMAFMSTLSTYGRGLGVCIATGMDTEIGKIAEMLNSAESNSTPLQQKLAKLGKILGFAAVGISIIIFIIGVCQHRNIPEMFMTSISLAVAAIPEGLPAIVAIVLALGVQRMIKENAIVKKLPAVETLGSVNIICSDKTGTLTINQMTVKKFYINNSEKSIDTINLKNSDEELLVTGMILCNDATATKVNKTGDPTEIALLDVGISNGLFKEDIDNKHIRLNEIPFDSDRKLMSTVNKFDEDFILFTKGAIDNILLISDKILLNGNIIDFTEDLKETILDASISLSNDALRILALSYKIISNPNESNLESNLIFVGFMGMIDPPRLEVKSSIDKCKTAGIGTIMITGDHKNTAFAIGKELGIASSLEETLSGEEIDRYSQEEFSKIVNKFSIFARVSPEHKVRIVKALKSQGNIVSMTGDGVNDAPSLQAADIGVAMGITGTDVAKGAADMVLTDDNFTTIVSAVEEGRNIFNNIRKSIIFLLSCNLGEVVALFTAILFNWAAPLLPIHILWVNLITDSFPALSLGVDPGDSSVMNKPPNSSKESIFSGGLGIFLIINGLLIGLLTLVAFKLGELLYPDSLRHAQTMAFVVLSISQLFYSFSLRNNKKSLFSIGVFSNKYLIASLLFGITIQFLVITIPPIAAIFKVYSLSFMDWGIVLLISLIPFVINELIKLILRYFK